MLRIAVVFVIVIASFVAPLFAGPQDQFSGRFREPGTTPGSIGGAPTGQSQGGRGLPTGPMGPSSPRRQAQPVMVRVDITINDQRAGGPAEKKTLTMLVADGEHSIIRSEERQKGSSERGASGPSLNVEASPVLLQDDKIRLTISVLYDLPEVPGEAPAKADDPAFTTRLQESFGLVVDNKKPMIVSQSADPRGSRKVTVEVTATILR
jgi:hypothetical protein